MLLILFVLDFTCIFLKLASGKSTKSKDKEKKHKDKKKKDKKKKEAEETADKPKPQPVPKAADELEIDVFRCDPCGCESKTTEFFFSCSKCCTAVSSFDLCEACYYATKKNRGDHEKHEFQELKNPAYQGFVSCLFAFVFFSFTCAYVGSRCTARGVGSDERPSRSLQSKQATLRQHGHRRR